MKMRFTGLSQGQGEMRNRIGGVLMYDDNHVLRFNEEIDQRCKS